MERVGQLSVSQPEVCVSLGVPDDKRKDLKLPLNNGLKNMSLYVPILDHLKTHKYIMPQHRPLFIRFGAFGFFFF